MHAPVGQVQTRTSGLLEIGYEWTYKRRPPTAFNAFDQEFPNLGHLRYKGPFIFYGVGAGGAGGIW